MTTKENIINLADTLIREKGYNAFSFNDISKSVGIKTASIHYHFPVKSQLGVAVIELHIEGLKAIIEAYKTSTPLEQLEKFFSIYYAVQKQNKVCIVGSLATDFNTLDENVQSKLKVFSEIMLNWVSTFLEQGKEENAFTFKSESRTKAIMIITNMLAIVQLSRLTNKEDFVVVKNEIINNLTQN